MAAFTRSDDLRGAEFVDVDLRNARFVRTDLSGAVMREADVRGLDIDAPWLASGNGTLFVNGVDVAPPVEAELNRRFPGREQRWASDPEGLRAAWVALESAWASAVDRVTQMPAGTVDISVDGEWTFAQTLRHLVLATDVWLRKAVLRIEEPFHPIGQTHADAADDGLDMSIFANEDPTFDEVLVVRAERVAMVRDYLAVVTAEQLTEDRPNPWRPEHRESVLSCIHVVLEEEWEHLRYASRDLDAIAAGAGN